RALRMIIQVAVSLVMIGTAANAQLGEMSDSDYIQKAISAAPSAVGKDATVIRMDMEKMGNMRTLRAGTNGFTCMIMGPDAMCNDANSMEFFGAMMKHEPPPDKIGISYMLRGDDGASNTDPYARGKTTDNHWVVTGPHIMITGAAARTLGLTEASDPDPGKPYMMWAGTPYEHAMVPVTAK
ncbi:MAG TPA: hypothetical protein VGN39_13810, partial [Terriglobales bacterium]|nr:hypothetical protein [Terriglobales bacterium]